MKRTFTRLLVLAGLLQGSLLAQNLVNNYSLENYSSCPNNSSAIPNALSWNTARHSPEYLHGCSTGIYSDTPTNYFGYQVAAQGQAYGGALFYGSFLSSYLADTREHFYVTLSSPLVVGQTYYVQFKANLCDNSPFAVNRLGATFTNTYNSMFGIPNTAHVFTNAVVNDQTNWTTILGTFVPTVAYNALMIGNFFTDANCTVQATGDPVTIGYHAYYFIDDCYVSTTPPGPLDVKWDKVDVSVNGNVADVSWEFNQEDVDHYLLEASDDGQAFSNVQLTKAVQRTSAYHQLDTMRNHMPTTFYRVRAVMRDGNTHLSPVIEAKRFEAGIDFLMTYPSPISADEMLTVEYNTTSGAASEVKVISIDGRVVRTIHLPETEAGHQFHQVSMEGLSPGAYILKAGSLTRKFMVTE